VRVAESGIHSGSDVAKLRAAGYAALLIGESLMSAPSPGKALVTLMKDAMTEKVAGSYP
jgi:indole-3-glycerol phosphate synthase